MSDNVKALTAVAVTAEILTSEQREGTHIKRVLVSTYEPHQLHPEILRGEISGSAFMCYAI